MSILVDTHLHSTASDGLWTPEEVVENATQKGLKIIALTDHNTTKGVPEALKAGKNHDIKIIPGIEFHCTHYKPDLTINCIGVVGLGIDIEKTRSFEDKINNNFNSLLHKIVELYHKYLDSDEFEEQNKTKKFQVKRNARFTLNDISKIEKAKQKDKRYPLYLNKSIIQLYMSENCLENTPALSELKNDFRRNVMNFRNEYKEIFDVGGQSILFKDSIEVIKNAGGLAFLAHPGISRAYNRNSFIKGWLKPEEEWFLSHEGYDSHDFIKEMIEYGLDGLEIYNYSGKAFNNDDELESDSINRYIVKMAEKYNLLTTYGSDCHGHKENGPFLGTFGSETIPKWINKII